MMTVRMTMWTMTIMMMIMTTTMIHHVSKNVPPLTCYNLDVHDPITIIFCRKCY